MNFSERISNCPADLRDVYSSRQNTQKPQLLENENIPTLPGGVYGILVPRVTEAPWQTIPVVAFWSKRTPLQKQADTS